MTIFSYMDIAKEEASFNEAYGAAMVQWGIIEQRLCFWFVYLTQMPENMAPSMFYDGVTSFAPRLRLLGCAIDAAPIPDLSKKVLRTITKKCGRYSSTRNQLSHCETKYDMDPASPTFKQLKFFEGAAPRSETEAALELRHLPIIKENFRELAKLIIDVYAELPENNEASLRALREQIHRLPISAHDTTPNPNPLKD
jgi:hypothetical protein